MSTLTLLHDPNNEESRDFLTKFADAGNVISDPEQARAFCSTLPGFPSVVYADSSGRQHALLSPADMAAVEAWRAVIDSPPSEIRPTVITKYAFLTRFTATELAASLAAVGGSVPLQVGQKLLDAASVVDLNDVNIQTYMGLLVQAGALSQARATAIITP